MILIAHRGNIKGTSLAKENTQEYILQALELGYHVEIDVWVFGCKLFLGHDQPEQETQLKFLQDERLWCHCKSREALAKLISNGVHCFFHETDDVTLTSKGYMWVYPNKKPLEGSICVLPELHNCKNQDLERCVGICSDYIDSYKDCA